jgi:hypothetical protein
VTPGDEFNAYLCAVVRQEIEKRYYARVNTNARLEQLIQNSEFLRDPAHHVALFPDHGVVHVRDVANQIIQVLDVVHGVLIPSRSLERFHFMKAFGVLVAYVHDIGMFDFSPFGRTMHPEYAAQAVLGSEFDQLITKIHSEDCGGIIHHINALTQHGTFQESPTTVLREMLALSMCHSKTKVPIELLNDPEKLRECLLHTVTTGLKTLYLEQQIEPAQFPTSNHQTGDSFFWLISDDARARELTRDVIDTLRALRAADSLRQRGTVLKTSGNYEIMVDRRSANAIWALRLGQDRLFLLESNDPLAAGEANIASSALEQDGSLRIGFHNGSFWEQGAIFRAACNAARVVNDIQEDVINSFNRTEPCDCRLQSSDVPILLEGTDDNLEFTEMVRQELLRLNPNLRNPVRCVPSLHNATTFEITRYLDANNLDWDTDKRLEFIEKVAASGTKTENIVLPHAFQDVRLIKLSAAQVLIEANSPAAFVYIPLGEGLKVIPLGGYDPFPVLPWMPLGNTGVIRGAVRNADVIAEQTVELIMIPQEVYLKYWHHPYTPEELRHLLSGESTRISK